MNSSPEIPAIAFDLAEKAKASGFGCDDLGCFFDQDLHGSLTGAQWLEACERAEAIFETVEPSPDLYAAWSHANALSRAEDRAEQFTPFGTERTA